MIDYDQMLSSRAMELKPSGIRKFFDILEEMQDVVSLTVGQPDFDTPWHIREAGIRSLEEGRTYYTSNSGTVELRREISAYQKRRFGLEYDPKNEIIVTVGGSEAIDLALRSQYRRRGHRSRTMLCLLFSACHSCRRRSRDDKPQSGKRFPSHCGRT